MRRYAANITSASDRPAVDSALRAWFHEGREAAWRNSAELKAKYRTASIVGDERAVFNIKGNAYRLVVSINHESQIVFIKWFRTHEEYDKINVRTVEYGD